MLTFTRVENGTHMGRQGTILVVDDNKSILKALELLLEKYFARTVMISSPIRGITKRYLKSKAFLKSQRFVKMLIF